MNPEITIHDAATGITETRPMTQEEYSALINSAWTDEPATEEPAPVEEAQASTDAG